MNAADVLAERLDPPEFADEQVAALLAHGEQGQGVYIDPEGEMWDVEVGPVNNRIGPHFGKRQAWLSLVPLSAEAGDTDG